jgi:hypothetical protein
VCGTAKTIETEAQGKRFYKNISLSASGNV